MARRVSVKGKGADLFFGEHDAETVSSLTEGDGETASPPPPVSPRSASPTRTSNEGRERPDKTTIIQASKQASKQEHETQQGTATLADVWESVASAASVTNSFRYTEHELTWLADVLYAVSKQHGVRLTKQDVARLGLNVVLQDYEARGDASLLAAFAERKKQR